MREMVCKINPKWLFFIAFCLLEIGLFFIVFYGPGVLRFIAFVFAVVVFFVAKKKSNHFVKLIADFLTRPKK